MHLKREDFHIQWYGEEEPPQSRPLMFFAESDVDRNGDMFERRAIPLFSAEAMARLLVVAMVSKTIDY